VTNIENATAYSYVIFCQDTGDNKRFCIYILLRLRDAGRNHTFKNCSRIRTGFFFPEYSMSFVRLFHAL